MPASSAHGAEAEHFGQLHTMHLRAPRVSVDAAMSERPSSSTADGTEQLWRLSRHAIENGQLRAIIESCDSWQIPAVLNATVAGRELLAGLDSCDELRRRARNATHLDSHWTDDPTPIIESLRELMRLPDGHAPAFSRLAA